MISLYTRWFHRWALIAGWAAAMIYGTAAAYRTPGGGQAHFGASTEPVFGHVIYIAVAALAVNLAVAAAGTLLFHVTGVPNGHDETRPENYTADPEGPRRPRPRGLAPPAATAVPIPTASATARETGLARGDRAAPRPGMRLTALNCPIARPGRWAMPPAAGHIRHAGLTRPTAPRQPPGT